MYAVLTSFLADAESELKHANAIDANAIFVIFISFSVLFCFVLSAPSVMQDLSLSQIGLQQFICRFVPESPYRFFLDLAYSFPGEMILGSDFFERQFRCSYAIEGSNDFLVLGPPFSISQRL